MYARECSTGHRVTLVGANLGWVVLNFEGELGRIGWQPNKNNGTLFFIRRAALRAPLINGPFGESVRKRRRWGAGVKIRHLEASKAWEDN